MCSYGILTMESKNLNTAELLKFSEN